MKLWVKLVRVRARQLVHWFPGGRVVVISNKEPMYELVHPLHVGQQLKSTGFNVVIDVFILPIPSLPTSFVSDLHIYHPWTRRGVGGIYVNHPLWMKGSSKNNTPTWSWEVDS